MTQTENNSAETVTGSFYDQIYQTVSETVSAASSYTSSRIPSPDIITAIPEIPSL